MESPNIVILEIGRPIQADVIAFLKNQGFDPGKLKIKIVSVPRAIIEAEYPYIWKLAYDCIRELGSEGKEVWLFLSGPLGLAFGLGQIVGLQHWKVIVYQFSAGSYRPVPVPTREILF
jgi:hypothetical protein